MEKSKPSYQLHGDSLLSLAQTNHVTQNSLSAAIRNGPGREADNLTAICEPIV
jgi:hypothetical protein